MSDIKGFIVNNNTYGIEDEAARAGLPIANPTLAGTETELNGLQIGNTKYKIVGEQGETGEAGVVYSEEEPTSESHPLWVHDGDNVQIPILDDSNIGSGLTYSNQKMNATFAKLDDVDLIADTLNVKKWNQIIKNGNFVDTSNWGRHGGSISVSNNVLTFVQSGTDIQIFQSKTLVNGHKYFCSFTGKSDSTTLGLTIDNVSESQRLALVCDNEWHTCEVVFEADNDYSTTNNPFFYGLGSVGSTVQIKNVFTVDLTDLYGAGNEPTAEKFRKMFPNEYYDYNAGTIINGVIPNLVTKQNKIVETVVNQNWQGNGYNLIPYPYKSIPKTDNGITWTIKEDGGLEVSGTAVATSYFDCTQPDFTAILPKGTYHISDNYNNDDLLCWLQFTNTSGAIYSNTSFTVDSNTPYKVCCRVKSGATIPSGTILYPMLVKVNDDGTYQTEYQRYAMGNVELTNKLGDVETLLADL